MITDGKHWPFDLWDKLIRLTLSRKTNKNLLLAKHSIWLHLRRTVFMELFLVSGPNRNWYTAGYPAISGLYREKLQVEPWLTWKNWNLSPAHKAPAGIEDVSHLELITRRQIRKPSSLVNSSSSYKAPNFLFFQRNRSKI